MSKEPIHSARFTQQAVQTALAERGESEAKPANTIESPWHPTRYPRSIVTVGGWILDGNRFLGIEWHFWKALGWAGNIVFFSRFFVQWIATERRKQVVVPISFWWLSLIGSILLLTYGIWQRDSVFIFAYAFTWIPYIRSLVIHYRSKAAQKNCPGCQAVATCNVLFCQRCGSRLPPRGSQRTIVPGEARSAFV